jgi:hypothetical protein
MVIGAVSCAGPVNPHRATTSNEERPANAPRAEGVTGNIMDPERAAVVDATVLAASLDVNGPAVPELAIITDAGGRYTWPLGPGRYELTVLAEGYERLSKSVFVRPGEVAQLDFVLSPSR